MEKTVLPTNKSEDQTDAETVQKIEKSKGKNGKRREKAADLFEWNDDEDGGR